MFPYLAIKYMIVIAVAKELRRFKMAQFDESKVINCLHPEKAEVGKKYWYSDSLAELKRSVVRDSIRIGEVVKFSEYADYPFSVKDEEGYHEDWEFLYPYEEPLKQRMTNRQFCEWLAKGNGQWKWNNTTQCYTEYPYPAENDCNEVSERILIRPWDSEEWVEPTVDIYERDCKKES